MISPRALAHVVYRTSQFTSMRDWYIEVLGAHAVFENERACFLTYDEEHHRIAILADAETPDRTEKSVVDHIAFSYETLRQLLDTHDRLADVGIKPAWTVNHGPTTSFYYADPDSNGVELQVDNYKTVPELHAFFSTPQFAANPRGIDVDPANLRDRLESGEPEETLLLRPDVLTG